MPHGVCRTGLCSRFGLFVWFLGLNLLLPMHVGASSLPDVQQRYIETLAAGGDVSGLLPELSKTGQQQIAQAPRPMQASEFSHQLNALGQQLAQLSATSNISAEQVHQIFLQLQITLAADLLMQERFKTVQEKLAQSSASGQLSQRLQLAQTHYNSRVAELLDSLRKLYQQYEQAENKDTLVADSSFTKALRHAAAQASQLIQAYSSQQAPRILGQGFLPYRGLALSQRQLDLTASIQPSYANPDETNVPDAADLAASIDAPLSEDILQQAAALGNDYIRIYEFVRNEIDTEWYAGSMKGASATLRQGAGNDIDQASLLIALYRASGLAARYVHGVIELPIERVMNSLGLSNAAQATRALNRAGLAFSPVIKGGRVAAVNIEHTWVAAYVPYTNYRGAMVDTSGSVWLPLMPAVKEYSVTPATDIYRQAGVNTAEVIDQYLLQSQSEDVLTRIKNTLQDYLALNRPEETLADQTGGLQLQAENLGLLPNTLPLTVVNVNAEQPVLDDARRYRVRFTAREGLADSGRIVLDHNMALAELAGERITLSYIPATLDDQRTSNLFGGLDLVPAYLIKLKPQIKLNGRQTAVANAGIDTGITHRFDIEITGPGGTYTIKQNVIAGSYHAVALAAGAVEQNIKEDDPGDTEYQGAALLSRLAYEYSKQWSAVESELAGLMNMAVVRPLPSAAIVSNDMRVDNVLGQPNQISWQAVTLDAAMRVAQVISRGEDIAAEVEYMRLSALQGSVLEHKIFETLYLVDSVSADKAIQLAYQTGSSVFELNGANYAALRPLLTHPANVLAQIEYWINRGHIVTTPVNAVTVNDWSGHVWRIEDPINGNAGYFIAGGLAGGSTTQAPGSWVLDWLRDALAAANTPPPNTNPGKAASITKISTSDWQSGEAGQRLSQPFAVLVRDTGGVPVQGARVTFRTTLGGGSFSAGATDAVALTDQFGVAMATLTLGESVRDDSIFMRRNPSDAHLSMARINNVEVFVESDFGTLFTSTPFSATALPGPAQQLLLTHRLPNNRTPARYAGFYAVRVNDQFGNPVSGESVTVAMGGGIGNTCPADVGGTAPPGAVFAFDDEACSTGTGAAGYPSLGECGSTEVTVTTNAFGHASAGVIAGSIEDMQYPITIRNSGRVVNSEFDTCSNFFGNSLLKWAMPLTANGNPVAAARPGETIGSPWLVRLQDVDCEPSSMQSDLGTINITETIYDYNNCGAGGCAVLETIVIWAAGNYYNNSRVCGEPRTFNWTDTDGVVTFDVSDDGSAGPTVANGSYYEADITVGLTPGPYQISAEAEEVLINTYTFPLQSAAPVSVPTPISYRIRVERENVGTAFAILPAVQEVIAHGLPASLDSSRIYIDRNGFSLYPVEIIYGIEPAIYEGYSASLRVYEDSALIYNRIGQPSGVSSTVIARGTRFDPRKRYEAEVVVNTGTPYEVLSDRFELPVQQELILSYGAANSIDSINGVQGSIYVSQSVDIVNQRSCNLGSQFMFELSEAARVTLEFFLDDTTATPVRLINNELYPEGVSTFDIMPSDLSPGNYRYTLSAVSVSDGNTDQEQSVGLVEFNTLYNLPVGHTIVKGVDVFNGNLSVSSNDISVPGRGVPLELRRSYSSSNSAVPGTLGIGWNHNYNSRISLNRCNEVTVIGAAGGAISFVPDGSDGLRPLRGYHGSLIRNSADRSFDFYAVDGTRYHYRNFNRRDWDLVFIEDTNGNVTKLGYDPSSQDIAKLLTVEDAAGRRLEFTYEDRRFDNIPGSVAVITQIKAIHNEINELMSISFAYDEFGNLTRAARETDSRVELYAYNTDATLPIHLRHKLSSYTDPNGNITSYEYDETTQTLTPVSGGSVTVPLGSVAAVNAPSGTTRFSYNTALRDTDVTNPRNANNGFAMNSYGSVETFTRPSGSTRTNWTTDDVLPLGRTDANNVQATFSYDADGNVLTERVAGSFNRQFGYENFAGNTIKNRLGSQRDRNNKQTQFRYDTRGNLTRVIDPEGGITEHVYNAQGDRISTRDANGNVTRFKYDEFGNIAETIDALGNRTVTKWDARSLPISIRDALGRTTTNEYDSLGRLFISRNARGGEVRFTYDDFGNKLTETDEMNRVTTFGYDAEHRLSRITRADNSFKRFEYDGNGNKILEQDWNGNITRFFYDNDDRLDRREEPEGIVTTFSYDAVGNKLSETILNPVGAAQTTIFDYDDLRHVTSITDARNGVRRFSYDGEGNKLTETDQEGRVTRFDYDGNNRLLQITDAEGGITSFEYDLVGNKIAETDANGHRREFEYDALNRVLRIHDALGHTTTHAYDDVGNLISVIDANLNETRFEYDELNRKEREIDAKGNVTRFVYDDVGNVIEEHLPNTNIVLHGYNDLNRLIRSEDSLGQLLVKIYDNNGNVLQQRDANNNLTINTYDDQNRLIRQVLPESRTLQFSYDVFGNKTQEIDANGNTTDFAYDSLNRLLTQTDAKGNTITFGYDRVGNKLTETDKRNNTTIFAYDNLNRVIGITDALAQSASIGYDAVGNKKSETNKRGIQTLFTYDPENRLLTSTKAGVLLLSNTYDKVGNKASEQDANGHKVTFIYDERNQVSEESRPLAAITRFAYNAMGDKIEERDPEGRITRFGYDLRRRLSSQTNGENETETYGYDGNGNRTRLQRPIGNAWIYAYDGADRLFSVTDPRGGVTTYGYDFNGNRLTQTDANNNTTTFSYDELDRRTGIIYADATRITFGYDANGNRSSMIDANGLSFTFIHDVLNREATAQYPAPITAAGDAIQSITRVYDANNNPRVITENYTGATGTRVTTQQYDDFDRLSEKTDGDNQTITYTYDANGNRKTVKDPDGVVTRYDYDALNRVATVLNQQGITEYHYDRSSLKARVNYPNGSEVRHTYDNAGRIFTIENRQNSAIVSRYEYDYDDNGNRTQQIETNGGAAEITGYRYDTNDRLTQVTYPNETVTYTYDDAYNRLTEITAQGTTTTESKTYSYNNRNQVTGITDSVSGEQIDYDYDNNGNRISKTIIPAAGAAVTTAFNYDVRDQLRQITQGGSSVGQFLYDYQGLRIRKQTATDTILYIYDDQSVLLQTDTAGNTQAKYDYGPDRLLSMSHITEGAQFYLFDALGSVVNLTRNDGSIQARYQYDAWGHIKNQVGTSANVFGFTGHEMDPETGLIYMKARLYDPDTGRFLSQDAFEGTVDTPPSLHKYLYAFGNPLFYFDPDGNESVSTMIDNAAEGCGVAACLGWAVLKAGYQVASLGFATVHDPVRDAYDNGQISGGQYIASGIGGGSAAVAATIATGRLATPFLAAAQTTRATVAIGAATGFTEGVAVDAITQTSHISAGLQEEFSVSQNLTSGALGLVIGGGAAGSGRFINDQIQMRQQAQKAQQQPKVMTESATAPTTAAIPQTNSLSSNMGDAVGDSVGAMRVRNAIVNQDGSRFIATSRGDVVDLHSTKFDIGLERELRVAEQVRGKLAKDIKGQDIEIEIGGKKTGIDVIAQNGDLIQVGGPGKGSTPLRLQKTLEKLEILKQEASRRNVKAKAFFAQGDSPQFNNLIEEARKVLGEDNVIIFSE